MTATIHPSAYIADGVVLGDDVSIGPFAVIETEVTIGDRCVIGAHAVVASYVTMGDGNVVHPHAVLGGAPQDLSFKPDTVSGLTIGDNNVFREGFTAHRAGQENGSTRIGSGCYFMANSHVAHDCSIGDSTIFANNVAIGGHVDIGHHVFMGGAAVVHQFCRVGAFAMVRGNTGLSMDALPFMLIGGSPGRHYKLNSVGLRRAGITGERYDALSAALRLLRNKQDLDALPETEDVKLLKDWLAVKSRRGVHGFVGAASS